MRLSVRRIGAPDPGRVAGACGVRLATVTASSSPAERLDSAEARAAAEIDPAGFVDSPDTLPGRTETVELWPFSQGEIDGAPDGFIDAVFDGPTPQHSSNPHRTAV